MKARRLCTVVLMLMPSGTAGAQDAAVTSYASAREAGYVPLESWTEGSGRMPSALMRHVQLNLHAVTLQKALFEIASQARLGLSYGEDLVREDRTVSLEADGMTVAEALARVAEGTPWVVLVNGAAQLAVVREEPSRRLGTVVGRVTDASSGAGLSGASVLLEGTDLGAVTENTGRYQIADVPAMTYTVVAQQLGYAEAEKSVIVKDGSEATVDFALRTSALPIDEIVATGTAFETRVRTVPNPISVITAREIEQKQVSNLTDLLRGEIPGVIALSNGQLDYRSPIYVRGNASWTTADYIKTYIDGVEVANPSYLSTIDPKSIERIEVVRGPQSSAIYGSEASSGVLQLFTKKGRPGLDRPQVDLQVSAGTIESDYRPSDGSPPLTQDHSAQVAGGAEAFSYRAGASYGTVGEWLTGYGSEAFSFSGGLRAAQGPLTIELTALWSDRNVDYANSPIFWDYPASSNCLYCGQPDLDYLNYDYALSQNTVGLTLRYRATDRWQHTLILGDDQNRFALHQPEPRHLTPADTFVELYNQETRRRSIRYHTAYEAELGSLVAGRVTGGVDYWSYDVQGSHGTNLLNAFGTVLPSENSSAAFDNDGWWNVGYFGMAELGFDDQFFLTLATRVEDNPHLGEEYGRSVSTRVGASYVRDLGPTELKLRAQYGNGVRPPPTIASAGQVTPSYILLANPEIGPEEKAGWDAGVELHWSRGLLSVTRYEEEGQNLIQSVDLDLTATPTIGQYQNIGRVGSKGWEVEARVNAGRITVEANYAHSDNVIQGLSNQYTSNSNSTYRVGDRMSNVPTHSAGGRLTARFWRGSASVNTSVMDEWRALDLVSYYGYLYGGEPDRGSMRDYYVTYSDALWKWSLRAEQALTERFTTFLRVDNLTNNQAADLDNSNVTPGRTVVVGLRVAY